MMRELSEAELAGVVGGATDQPTYGALYNYYAVKGDKPAPQGYLVPTPEDYAQLGMKLSG